MSTYSELWKAVDDNVPEYGPRPEDATAILDAVLAILRERVQALVEYGCPEWEVEPGDGFGRHVRLDQVLALLDVNP